MFAGANSLTHTAFLPLDDPLVLYCKAGPSSSQQALEIGDCPFCQTIRLVLEEMKLPYECQPTAPDSKPDWLVEHYQGKLPALRHGKECYVESSVITNYLLFFFGKQQQTESELKVVQEEEDDASDGTAATALAGKFFPAVAGYLKATTDDAAQEAKLRSVLDEFEKHLQRQDDNTWWCGNQLTIHDLRLAPQFYHLVSACSAFHKKLQLKDDYPTIFAYWQRLQQRESFQKTVYPASMVEWGWSSHR